MPYLNGNDYERVKRTLDGVPTSFPELHAVAEMRPHSHTIHLHELRKRAFVEDIQQERHGLIRPSLEVIYHELTHWVDLVATVWGQNYLVQLYDAYDAMVNQNEEKFVKWVELYDEDRRIMFPEYYRTTYAEPVPHSIDRPWRIQFSSGLEFTPNGHQDNARSIFFVKFSDHDSDELIARQPLSVGALLETCATWSELVTGMSMLHLFEAEEFRVASNIWSREKSTTLYNKELTVYTSPAHLLSFRIGTREAIRTYEFAAHLANVALNMTDEHFAQLRHPEEFAPFGEGRLDAFISSRNRGYAFAAICTNAPRTNDEQTAENWLEEALAASNLPQYAELLEGARTHLAQIKERATERNELDAIRDYILEVGLCFFDYRAGKKTPEITAEIGKKADLVLPPAFDADGELMALGPHHLDHNRYDAEFMYNMEMELLKCTHNFLVGCRGFKA